MQRNLKYDHNLRMIFYLFVKKVNWQNKHKEMIQRRALSNQSERAPLILAGVCLPAYRIGEVQRNHSFNLMCALEWTIEAGHYVRPEYWAMATSR